MKRKYPVDLAIAGIGVAYMAMLAFGFWAPPGISYFGTRLYDLYADALLHGRFDLPMRELLYEGHYAPDGTGYLYHGLGPLLTRLPFAPFVNFPTWWLSPLSILFWSVIGNICYHRAFFLALEHVQAGAKRLPCAAYALLALAVWFASPGVYLAASISLFFEPIAMAYGLAGAFVLLVAMVSFGKLALDKALFSMSLIAGLILHARPHLAIGYYAGVCLLAASVLLRGEAHRWRRAAAAMFILGIFGTILLASNVARFQSTMTMHGSFSQSGLQHGTTFWGLRDEHGQRANAFEDHGRFNAKRVIPNALVYFASPPEGFGFEAAIEGIEALNRAMIPSGDYVKIERPKVGMLFLWPGWILLMAIGLCQRALWRTPGLQAMIAVAIGGLLMLSYPTITLRYRVDLWPVIALPALFGLGPFSAWIFDFSRGKALAQALAAVLFLTGGYATATASLKWAEDWFGQQPGSYFAPWPEEFCLELAAKKGFGAERSRLLCELESEPDREGKDQSPAPIAGS